MRRLFSSSTRAQLSARFASTHLATPRILGIKQYQRSITDVRPRQASISRTWFTSSTGLAYLEGSEGDHKPPDERRLKLGETIRKIREHLPDMLASPLPGEILSPQITLHLFPSTHPHLPAASGKLAYTTALYTAPVAWGRVPIIGNVKLNILSERMVKDGGTSTPAHLRNEKLIVRWETCCGREKRQSGHTSEVWEKVKKIVGGSSEQDETFSGLFLFEFDDEGRIHDLTIEHAEEGGNYDKTSKVISVTDWLLGRAWGRNEGDGSPSLAFARTGREAHGKRRRRDH
ncbi:hypothetical protein CC78DRAFT_463806 [Lojkania enalia]|uniref:Uncharacterized protein n=1 Tax=Lojkania enalia TaxID=147567 RepID=A0A9P4K7Z9_9PLEO|nr:hypothetical protein CC78DRAFT_463806 [Didymosphaeria enalia]